MRMLNMFMTEESLKREVFQQVQCDKKETGVKHIVLGDKMIVEAVV